MHNNISYVIVHFFVIIVDNIFFFILFIIVTHKYCIPMSKEKDKHLSVRFSSVLYQKYIDKAIKRSSDEKRIVKVSEIIREVLEKGV
jgi:hypothetical protein